MDSLLTPKAKLSSLLHKKPIVLFYEAASLPLNKQGVREGLNRPHQRKSFPVKTVTALSYHPILHTDKPLAENPLNGIRARSGSLFLYAKIPGCEPIIYLARRAVGEKKRG